MALCKFTVERKIPGVGTLEREPLKNGAAQSNAALQHLAPATQ